jgi:hypothetical protein
MVEEDPRCPECGEPIGQTATYCMHCSADLTEEREVADSDDDGAWDEREAPSDAGDGISAESPSGPSFDESAGGGELLDPDGIMDDSLTVLVGIAGGIVIGVVGTFVLLIVTESVWSVAFGFLAWLAATAYLVRRRTVQGAISRSAYGVSLVLLLVPVIALSPVMEGGFEERGSTLVVLLVVVAVPAGIAAAIGWIASQFVPDDAGDTG